jgi:hypothetical protein
VPLAERIRDPLADQLVTRQRVFDAMEFKERFHSPVERSFPWSESCSLLPEENHYGRLILKPLLPRPQSETQVFSQFLQFF